MKISLLILVLCLLLGCGEARIIPEEISTEDVLQEDVLQEIVDAVTIEGNLVGVEEIAIIINPQIQSEETATPTATTSPPSTAAAATTTTTAATTTTAPGTTTPATAPTTEVCPIRSL